MQKREYMNANDAYLRLSIGNAPWPIGMPLKNLQLSFLFSRLVN